MHPFPLESRAMKIPCRLPLCGLTASSAALLFLAVHPATASFITDLRVSGLTPNAQHGFHVHEFGDESGTDAAMAKGHYNPAGVAHGLPPSVPRHNGDMGSIMADADGSYDWEAIGGLKERGVIP